MKKISSKKFLYILITIFWIITMTALIMKHYVPEGLQRISYTSPVPEELYEEQWMGVYFRGQKVGYSYRKITEIEDGYKILDRFKVRLKVMGLDKDIETVLDAYTNRSLRLEFFTFRLSADVNMDIKGNIEGSTLLITMKTGDVTSKKKIHLTEHPYLNLSIVPYILMKGLKLGNTVTIPVMNPIDMSQEYIKVEVLGKESLMSMGVRKHVYKLKRRFKGIETMIWLTGKGEVLREDSPMGFSLIKEAKESAMQLTKPSIDVVAKVSIPFNLSLSPDTIKYLKIRLSGVDLKELEVSGGRQRLNGDILEITKESLESMVENNPPLTTHLPLSKGGKGEERGFSDEYLTDTMFIQSKDPAIIELSREIIGEQKDLIEVTKLIHDWVYKNIKKVPMITMPLATDVLSMMQGDCNEHTVLFVALSRSAGIPTRIAVGLTYQDGFFYYHAWPEVYFNEWVAVDPTLGQFPADASHIRLLTGDIDRQLQLLSIIGKLKLDGIEYR